MGKSQIATNGAFFFRFFDDRDAARFGDGLRQVSAPSLKRRGARQLDDAPPKKNSTPANPQGTVCFPILVFICWNESSFSWREREKEPL